MTTGNTVTDPRPGYDFVGVWARWCLDKNSSEQEVAVGSSPWTLHFPDGQVEASSNPGSNSSLHPSYPEGVVVPLGTCLEGWIGFQAPKGQRPDLVMYAPRPRAAGRVLFHTDFNNDGSPDT